ncbi:hypothetical protein WG66_017058 [Moniliophthora roreri]|nr:hypothetical protein WG66_017058 [Moniliophthora roreri]
MAVGSEIGGWSDGGEGKKHVDRDGGDFKDRNACRAVCRSKDLPISSTHYHQQASEIPQA